MKRLIKLLMFGFLIFSSGLLYAQSEQPTITQSEDIFRVIFDGGSGPSGEITLDELSAVKGLELFTTSHLYNAKFLSCYIILSSKVGGAVRYKITDLTFDLGFLTRLSLLESGDRIIIESGKLINPENEEEIMAQPTVYTVI